jgi:hypothetical protein
MKQLYIITVGILLVSMLAGTALAVDIQTLDRVSINMTRTEVLSHLGKPEQVVDAGNGLTADIYPVANLEPMVGTGCIYHENQRLAGQAFVFQGKVDREAAERLKKHGFTVMEDTEGAYRLLGKDDDSGHPLVAHIVLTNGMTVIMTFEKGFYDRTVD